MRILRSVILASSMLCPILAAAPALAGEEVLYESAPDWVAPADLAAARENSTTNLVILDRQVRIEDGQLWEYSDTGIRMASAQELTQAGTIGATWLPDKGDLIIHEISIQRGDAVIDVVAAGSRLEILRREQSLEQRMLDGQLTAVLAVPGLQVGDILRTRYSITRSDEVLQREVDSTSILFREPDIRPGFARVRASWPEDAPVRYQAGPAVELPPVTSSEGYQWLEITLPLAKAEDVPEDAPFRYFRPSLLQVSTFADWAEVASVQAPLYDPAGTIAAGSELAQRVAGIVGAHQGDLARAVAALELVQEEIGYLANGLDGGDFRPQSPQETWDLRYGDCKAKTKLLLALLAEMGIEAEPVLVSTQIGDALPELLPGALFDHIMVRARIDGAQYWLDGTSAGANAALAGNVPPFHYALPVRAGGAELEPIRQVLPRVPDTVVTIDVDQRAGLDIPVLANYRFEIVGPGAAFLTANRAQLTEDQRFELGNAMAYPLLGPQQITSVSLEEGSDDSEITVLVQSLMTSPTRFDGAIGEHQVSLPVGRFRFAPDRSRRQWRDIPVNLGEPRSASVTYRLQLPDGGEGYTLVGQTQLDETIAGHSLFREARLDGDLMTVVERVSSAGGEVPAAAITEERRKAGALARDVLTLRAPGDAARRWRFAGAEDRTLLQPVEDAYSARIARKPDEVESYTNRARFRMMTYDFAGAAEDFTAAIELEGSADLYALRSQAYADMLDRDRSREDLAEAYALDPTPWRAMALAEAMADTDRLAEARELLEEQYGDEDVRQQLAYALADLDAREGNFEQGLERIDALLIDRENDADLLNSKCWFMGTWNVAVEEALPLCIRAVESAQNPGPVLDSRAMAYLRGGQLDAALADANAALALQPGLTATVLLRGLIRRELGEDGAQNDIRDALARSPAIAKVYRRFGFDLPQ